MESLTFLKPHYLCFRMLLSKVKNNAIKHFEAVISSLAFGMSKQPLHESDMEFRLCRLWNKHFCFDLWVSIDFLKTAHIDATLCASILLLFYWHFLVFETHLLPQFWSEGLEIHNTVGQLSKAPQEGKIFQIKPPEPAPGLKRCRQWKSAGPSAPFRALFTK